MIYVIYLAGGSGRRFGSNKLLYEINGKAMYMHGLSVLEKLKAAFNNEKHLDQQIEGPIVVTYHQQINDECLKRGIIVVMEPECVYGISRTIKKGIETIKKKFSINYEKDFLLFCGSDQPYLSEDMLKDYIVKFLISGKGTATVACKGNVSNPTIFSTKYINDFMKMEGDKGGRKIIENSSDDCFVYEIDDEHQIKDIDYREDIS